MAIVSSNDQVTIANEVAQVRNVLVTFAGDEAVVLLDHLGGIEDGDVSGGSQLRFDIGVRPREDADLWK